MHLTKERKGAEEIKKQISKNCYYHVIVNGLIHVHSIAIFYWKI